MIYSTISQVFNIGDIVIPIGTVSRLDNGTPGIVGQFNEDHKLTQLEIPHRLQTTPNLRCDHLQLYMPNQRATGLTTARKHARGYTNPRVSIYNFYGGTFHKVNPNEEHMLLNYQILLQVREEILKSGKCDLRQLLYD